MYNVQYFAFQLSMHHNHKVCVSFLQESPAYLIIFQLYISATYFLLFVYDLISIFWIRTCLHPPTCYYHSIVTLNLQATIYLGP